MTDDLRKRFTDLMKEGMKNRDELTTGTARLIIAALKEKDIFARGQGREAIEAPEIMTMLQTMVKQRQESAKMYTDGGRPELAAREQAEIAIIEQFLPKQMSDADMDAVITQTIAALGVASIKDMGRAMAEIKAKYAGQLDMTKASAKLKEKLSG